MVATIEIRSISRELEIAKDYGLLTEVVWSALHYLKENPEVEPADAISYGLLEWIK